MVRVLRVKKSDILDPWVTFRIDFLYPYCYVNVSIIGFCEVILKVFLFQNCDIIQLSVPHSKSLLIRYCARTPTWKYLTSLFLETELGSQELLVKNIKSTSNINIWESLFYLCILELCILVGTVELYRGTYWDVRHFVLRVIILQNLCKVCVGTYVYWNKFYQSVAIQFLHPAIRIC